MHIFTQRTLKIILKKWDYNITANKHNEENCQLVRNSNDQILHWRRNWIAIFSRKGGLYRTMLLLQHDTILAQKHEQYKFYIILSRKKKEVKCNHQPELSISSDQWWVHNINWFFSVQYDQKIVWFTFFNFNGIPTSAMMLKLASSMLFQIQTIHEICKKRNEQINNSSQNYTKINILYFINILTI